MGSMYNGSQKSGYHTPNNDLKAFQTRSGTKIIFNDAQGSILIEDPSESKVFMDGKGNIKVNAPETYTVNAKNICLNAAENISLDAGINYSLNAGVSSTYFTRGNSTLTIKGRYIRDIGEDYISNFDKNKIVTSNGAIESDSDGIILNNSQKELIF
jgi:type VI secretion system secreted protein VgrG